jgi:hypothetical protein
VGDSLPSGPPDVGPPGSVWYGVDMTTEQTVPTRDVEAALADLEPGSTHSAARLYQLYVRAMEKERRSIAHPTSLGHALAAYGCERVRIRKRVGGQPTEKAGWRLPGRPTQLTVDPVAETLRAFADGGFIPEDELYGRYLRLCSSNNWGAPMARPAFMAGLTRLGRPRSQLNRRPVRYVAPNV